MPSSSHTQNLAVCSLGLLAAPALALSLKPAVRVTTPLCSDQGNMICVPLCIGIGPGGTGGGGNQYPNDAAVTSAVFSFTIRPVINGDPTTGPIGGTLRRGVLDAVQAHGFRLNGGFPRWPDGSQPGGLTGVNWPFRDPMNFGGVPPEPPSAPGGFDAHPNNGTIFNRDSGGTDIVCRQLVSMYGVRTSTTLGVRDPVDLYSLAIDTTDPRPRDLLITINLASAEVRRATTGEVIPGIDLEPFSMIITVPAPVSGGVLGLALCVFTRRRSPQG